MNIFAERATERQTVLLAKSQARPRQSREAASLTFVPLKERFKSALKFANANGNSSFRIISSNEKSRVATSTATAAAAKTTRTAEIGAESATARSAGAGTATTTATTAGAAGATAEVRGAAHKTH